MERGSGVGADGDRATEVCVQEPGPEQRTGRLGVGGGGRRPIGETRTPRTGSSRDQPQPIGDILHPSMGFLVPSTNPTWASGTLHTCPAYQCLRKRLPSEPPFGLASVFFICQAGRCLELNGQFLSLFRLETFKPDILQYIFGIQQLLQQHMGFTGGPF